MNFYRTPAEITAKLTAAELAVLPVTAARLKAANKVVALANSTGRNYPAPTAENLVVAKVGAKLYYFVPVSDGTGGIAYYGLRLESGSVSGNWFFAF